MEQIIITIYLVFLVISIFGWFPSILILAFSIFIYYIMTLRISPWVYAKWFLIFYNALTIGFCVFLIYYYLPDISFINGADLLSAGTNNINVGLSHMSHTDTNICKTLDNTNTIFNAPNMVDDVFSDLNEINEYEVYTGILPEALGFRLEGSKVNSDIWGYNHDNIIKKRELFFHHFYQYKSDLSCLDPELEVIISNLVGPRRPIWKVSHLLQSFSDDAEFYNRYKDVTGHTTDGFAKWFIQQIKKDKNFNKK
jgi:hypothetical protein